MAVVSRPGGGNLSPRLTELAKPSVRSAHRAQQAKLLSLAAEGPGSLVRSGNRILVEVRFDRGAASGVDDLRATGAKIINVSSRYQTITVAAKPAELRSLAGVPRVAGATEVLAPITAAPACPPVSVVSEGDVQLHAVDARSNFVVDGSGVRVGVLSDSFDQDKFAATHEADDIESGDLPGAANTCGWTTPTDLVNPYEPEPGDPEPADEGRAMAQIVHDLAPGASLAFASAFNGLVSFAENIEELRDEGAKVIVDDVAYPIEPFFQEGPVGAAVSNVADTGVTYFSSAGNNNLLDLDGNEIGSWEAQQYRDAGICPPAVQAVPVLKGTHCLDFNPGLQADRTLGIKVAPGATLSVDLQWNEPWEGVGTDLDAFLLNSSGSLIAGSVEENIDVSQRPVEFVQWVNNATIQRTVQLVVNRYSGDTPRLKLALLENGFGVIGIEYPRSTGSDVIGPTIFGHNGAADAISVGAVPFDESSVAEDYSSRGPVTHYFGPADGTVPAAELPSAQTLAKPDVAATDCGATTFFGSPQAGVRRFCGTSAAAPHAAGVAALMSDAEPSATPEEVRAAMLSSAVPVGAFGGCAVGVGLIEAVGAIEDLLNTVASVEPACPPPSPEGSVEEAQAPGDWGSETPPSIPVEPDTEIPVPGPPAEPPVTPPPSDRLAPNTFFRHHPPKVLRTSGRAANATFRFGSNEAGAAFLCKFDRGAFRACESRTVRRAGLGQHVLLVKARDAAGNIDGTPAVFRFRVKLTG
jgi:Subtilase family